MLIGDDDDFEGMLEETDAALQDAEEEPPTPSATDSFSDAADDAGLDVDKLTQADFTLLPYVLELVQAHRARDASAAERKMADLRRAIRRVNTRLAALTHTVSGPAAEPGAAQALLEERQTLLARTKRTLEEAASSQM